MQSDQIIEKGSCPRCGLEFEFSAARLADVIAEHIETEHRDDDIEGVGEEPY